MQLLALLAAFLPGILATAPDPIADGYFQKACSYSKSDCKGLKAPLLLAVDTRHGLLGFHYFGTNIVFVTDRCFLDVADMTKCDGVAIHEMVHYIHGMKGLYADDKCESERIAWAAYNLYVLDMGRGDLVNTNWQKGYPQCPAKSQ